MVLSSDNGLHMFKHVHRDNNEKSIYYNFGKYHVRNALVCLYVKLYVKLYSAKTPQ